MNPKFRNPSRVCRYEPLEPRQLLAGNVNISFDPVTNALLVIGDASSNVLVVTQTGANSFKFTGGGTKINNGNSAVTENNVDDGIFINMGAGTNSLTLSNLKIEGGTDEVSLGIVMGDGTDALAMAGITTEYACGINAGGGTNAIAITKSTFGYDLGIQTYGGNDAIAISNTTVYGVLTIQMGNGTNALAMSGDKVLDIEEPGTPSSDLPDGFEILECAFDPEIDCGAFILGGSGVDAIAINSTTIDCLTQINTCSGADSVAIANSQFGDAPVAVSLESTLCWEDFELSGLCIETGAGNDAVAIANSTIYGFLQIDTSGDYSCPCFCSWDSGTVQPATPSSTSSDGNDAVSLAKVYVLESEASQICCCCCCDGQEPTGPLTVVPTELATPDTSGNWDCCCCCCCCSIEFGTLLIYTGNGADAVALASVNTDGEAYINTTDGSSKDGADAVSIANSNFNRYDNEIDCSELPWVVPAGLYITTGCGNDAVAISKVNVVGDTDICTGPGNDAVAINALVTDYIFIDMDSGTDYLAIANSTSHNGVDFIGVDHLAQAGNHF
jgi:hypothetical protein